MPEFDFNTKPFSLVENSENGSAASNTFFEYKQQNTLVTADYHGSGIKCGKIIARLENDTPYMRFQCLTDEDELKAAKAIALVSLNAKNNITLKLDWEWVGETQQKGVSEYTES